MPCLHVRGGGGLLEPPPCTPPQHTPMGLPEGERPKVPSSGAFGTTPNPTQMTHPRGTGRCGMRRRFAAPYHRGPRLQRPHSQTTKLFSAIAVGAFRGDGLQCHDDNRC